ncbi:RNA polymerase sigma factor [Acidobacteriota bacterium]
MKPERDVITSRVLPMTSAYFDEVFQEFQSHVFRFSCHLTQSQNEAEELFQETWLRAVQGFPEEFDRKRFKAWLFTVAANIHRDNLRKKRIRRLFLLDRTKSSIQNQGFQSYMLGGRLSSLGSESEDADFGRALGEAVAKLPERQRRVFVLKEIEGFKYTEIGEICDLPVGTVKSLLHRAVRRLRQELSAYNPKKERWPCDVKTLSV